MNKTSFKRRERGLALCESHAFEGTDSNRCEKADPSAQYGPRDGSYGIVSRGALSNLFHVEHFRIGDVESCSLCRATIAT